MNQTMPRHQQYLVLFLVSIYVLFPLGLAADVKDYINRYNIHPDIQIPSEPFVFNIQYGDGAAEREKFRLYLGPSYADSVEKLEGDQFHMLYERIFRYPLNMLFNVPNGDQLDRRFIKDFAKVFPYNRVFLTTNLERAW